MHWALQYLGLPWTPQGFGPTEFNCWGLVWHIQKERYNREVPKHAFVSPYDRLRLTREMERATHGTEWIQLDKPQEGCVVGLSTSKLVYHVGVYLDIDGGRILHSCEGKGVLAQSLPSLRANGWSLIRFYTHRSWPTS